MSSPFCLELRFDITESRTETFPSFAQCRFRVDIEVPCETGEGEEQIAEFMLLLLCRTGRRALWLTLLFLLPLS